MKPCAEHLDSCTAARWWVSSAVWVCGETPKRRPCWLNGLRDSEPDVVQAAARALGKIATPTAAQALRDALPATAAANQPALFEGLLRCAETFLAKGPRQEAVTIYDAIRLRPAPHQVQTAALRGAILARKDSDGLPLLVEALRSPDFARFAAAVRISQELPGSSVTKALVAELPSVPPDKQVVLIQALGKRGDAKAVPALVTVAQKSETPVRLAALRALPEFGAAAPVPPLLALLNDPDPTLARAAQEGLAGIPSKKVDEAALEMVASREPSRQILGMELLARRRVTLRRSGAIQGRVRSRAPGSHDRPQAFGRVSRPWGDPDAPGLRGQNASKR